LTNPRRRRDGWRLLFCSLMVGLRAVAGTPGHSQVPMAPDPPTAAEVAVLEQQPTHDELQRQND
jgi:hypothetical protein